MNSCSRLWQQSFRVGLLLGVSFWIFAGSVLAQRALPDSGPSEGGCIVLPSVENAWYWQIDGHPVMLLGANETDHTFLMPGRAKYLQELQAAGGNLIRNTMSQREPEPENRPHLCLHDGRYDLSKWNPAYWDKLDSLLAECQTRKLVVALEVWDKFDYQKDYWLASAWRPRNNVNYALSESGLRDTYGPTQRSPEKNELHMDNPFLLTLPGLDHNPLILEYQQAFVDKTLSVTLKYPNVLYFVGNEWKESPKWPVYWAKRIHRRAAAAGKDVPVSVMVWSSSKAFDPEIDFVLSRRDLFRFAGFRVGNPKIPLGKGHYQRIMQVRSRVGQDGPRPLVDSKVRTGNKTFFHPVRQARVWRGMMAGWSALSHHRVHNHPTQGPSMDMGFTDVAKANLRALRSFSDKVQPWECTPSANLLEDCDADEAYLLANPGQAYGVYFVLQGDVGLELPGRDASYQLHWINIETGETVAVKEPVQGGGQLRLKTPGDRSSAGWAATLVRHE